MVTLSDNLDLPNVQASSENTQPKTVQRPMTPKFTGAEVKEQRESAINENVYAKNAKQDSEVNIAAVQSKANIATNPKNA